MTSEQRIAKALEIAHQYGSIDGAHHKMWTIDQMVRALCGVPEEQATAQGAGGKPYHYTRQGTNQEYATFVREHNEGEDGPDTYAWDEGIAP